MCGILLCLDALARSAPPPQTQYSSAFRVHHVGATVSIGMLEPPLAGQFKNGTYSSSLHAVVPVVYGFALLGEASKFAAVSAVRFSKLQIDATALTVQVLGSIGER